MNLSVNTSDGLGRALAKASPGTSLRLASGVNYAGNFLLGTGMTIVADKPLPPGRAAPGGGLPVIISPNGSPALATISGSYGITMRGLEVTGKVNDLITLGAGDASQRTLDAVPADILLDRCYLHGDPVTGAKRGIALNSAQTRIRGCYISDFKLAGQDSQAVAGWNGPGPFLIDDTYLEGAGENLIFGGGDPAIAGLVPSDITIRRCTLSKPLAWRGQAWQVKNLLELKNARRVQVIDSVLENNWAGAQAGWSVLFTVRNQDGTAPWSTVEDVDFSHNTIRHVAMGLSILGQDNNFPSQTVKRIRITENLFEDVTSDLGGNGGWFLLMASPQYVSIDHNTLAGGKGVAVIQLDDQVVPNFSFTNNFARPTDYGIIGAGLGVGNPTITKLMPDGILRGNVLVGQRSDLYPPLNSCPATMPAVPGLGWDGRQAGRTS